MLAWGVNWSVTKQLVQFLPPLWTSAIRSWIALAGLFVILGLSNNLMIPERRDIPVVLSVALLHMTVFSVLVAAGVRFLPASKAIVLGYTTPLWVAIAAPLLGKDTLTAPKLAGALLGLIGLAVILNPTSIDWTNTNVVLGAGMVILAAISWAANIIYIRAHRWIASPLQLLIWQVLVATIVLTGSAVIVGRPAARGMVVEARAAVPVFRPDRNGAGLLGDVDGQQEHLGADDVARHHRDAARRYRQCCDPAG